MQPDGAEDSYSSMILALLADGKYHSGQGIADVLGISRTAVWKHLKKLETAGVSVVSVKGKGYCIDGGVELFDAVAIRSGLAAKTAGQLGALDVFSTVSSTNDYVLKQVQRVAGGVVCLAEQQTAGRGRRGREWVSPFGSNIYLSIGWGFEGGVNDLEGLSLAVGVVIARTLKGAGIDGIELKWPNDVLWRDQKLAGVLLEMTGDASGKCHVVIGIGINLRLQALSSQGIEQPWIDLYSICQQQSSDSESLPGRNALAAALIEQLVDLLSDYAAQRFSRYRDEWEALNAFAGKNVSLVAGSGTTTGVMIGVTESGALRVLTGNGEQVFYGGEISLRKEQ